MNCPYCPAKPFKSLRGLSHHQQKSERCMERIRAKFGCSQGNELPHSFVGFVSVPYAKEVSAIGNMYENTSKNADSLPAKYTNSRVNIDNLEQLAKRQRTDTENLSSDVDEDTENQVMTGSDVWHLEETGLSVGSAASSSLSSPASNVNTNILDNWRTYCTEAPRKFLYDFTTPMEVALNLLINLRKTNSPLNAYESMMDWHYRSVGELKYNQKLSDHSDYISREKIFKQLRQRYNFTEEKRHYIEELTLPHSRAKVQLVLIDPQWVIQSLLTDPRLTDEDFIFGEKGPFAPPKPKTKYIRDLNTGYAYQSTYKTLITDPTKQVLLPVIFYIDGANTGQFVDLPITAVKISLGIFTRKARDKAHLWKTLGFIPSYCKHVSRGREIVLESGHMEGVASYPNAEEEEEAEEVVEVVKAQDLHAMLAVIIRKYVDLQSSGFVWDLFYKGKCYKKVEFVLFTPFLKLDSDEAEKICGKYTSRSGNVKCLCRHCECPTQDTDKPYARYPLKTTGKISGMVAERDLDGLRNLSQQDIINSMYKIRFGSHNTQGVHGACPMEMLHALLLGIFRCTRDCFFEQIGPDSQLADDINAYAREFGDILSRQSQRDLPRTKFANGIRKGKLNAKDFPGILLCMACVLRCSGSRGALRKHRGHFKEVGVLQDWLQVVETLLEWEMWLKSDRLRRKHVEIAREKHRYIMYLIKKVSRRVKGMGLKITKYHAIMHMADDILNFGVPMEFDTGSNESGHKAEKKAAKLTQKKKALFDVQTCIRLEEVHLLDLAVADIEGLKLWNYYQTKAISEQDPLKNIQLPLGGQKLRIYYDETTGEFGAYVKSRGEKKVIKMEQQLVRFFGQLQVKVQNYCDFITIYSTYRRENLIFRASTDFMSKAWRDWAIIDWEEDERPLPCHIMGFVDLSELPDNFSAKIGGSGLIYTGIFAIVEATKEVDEGEDAVRSDLFVPYEKIVGGFTGKFVSHNKYYLADVEAIVGPAVVIPDVGGPTNRYLHLKDRSKWKREFEKWLEQPGHLDVVYSSDEESDADDRENYDNLTLNEEQDAD